jgi:hypothetical protein
MSLRRTPARRPSASTGGRVSRTRPSVYSLAMDPSAADRLIRLERQVDFLFRRLGIDPEAALSDDDLLPAAFYDALAQKKEIQAIKIYRAVTGVGLKQAKDAVELMMQQHR